MFPLRVRQRDGGGKRWGGCCDRCGCGMQVIEGDLQRRPGRKDDRALDDVLQLAYVARPIIANERIHDRGWDGLNSPAHPPSEPLREMAH